MKKYAWGRMDFVIILILLIFIKLLNSFIQSIELLILINYIFMGIILLFIGFIIIRRFEVIKNNFKNVKKKTWVILVIIFLLALFLRIGFSSEPEFSSEIEWEFKAVAKQISLLEIDEKVFGSFKQHSRGLPFLMSSSYIVLGVSDFTTMIFNSFIGSASIIIIFLLCQIIFNNQRIGLLSAFILSIFPQHLLMSGIGEAETIAVFFMLASILFFWMFLRNIREKEYGFLWIFLLLFIYSINIRLEIIVLVPVFILTGLLFYKKLDLKKVTTIIIVGLILLLPIVVFFNNIGGLKFILNLTNPENRELNNVFSAGKEYSFSENIVSFWTVITNNNLHPWIYFVFLFASLFYFIKFKKEIFFFILYLLNCFVIYGLIFSGLQNMDRYIMMFYPALIVLFGVGANLIIDKLNNLFKLKNSYLLTAMILLMLFYSFNSSQTSFYQSKKTISDIEELRIVKDYLVEDYPIAMCAVLPCEFEFSNERCFYPDLRNFKTDKFYYIKTISEQSFGCDGTSVLMAGESRLVASYKTISIYEVQKTQ